MNCVCVWCACMPRGSQQGNRLNLLDFTLMEPTLHSSNEPNKPELFASKGTTSSLRYVHLTAVWASPVYGFGGQGCLRGTNGHLLQGASIGMHWLMAHTCTTIPSTCRDGKVVVVLTERMQ